MKKYIYLTLAIVAIGLTIAMDIELYTSTSLKWTLDKLTLLIILHLLMMIVIVACLFGYHMHNYQDKLDKKSRVISTFSSYDKIYKV